MWNKPMCLGLNQDAPACVLCGHKTECSAKRLQSEIVQPVVMVAIEKCKGNKDDSGKSRVDLVLDGMPRALLALGQLSEFGAKKYGPHNWQRVSGGFERYSAAMDRHRLMESIRDTDPETGLNDVVATAWNALARLELFLKEKDSQ